MKVLLCSKLRVCSFRDKVPFLRHTQRPESVLMPGCVWMCGASFEQQLMSTAALERVKLPGHMQHSPTEWSPNLIKPCSLTLPLNEADTSSRIYHKITVGRNHGDKTSPPPPNKLYTISWCLKSGGSLRRVSALKTS